MQEMLLVTPFAHLYSAFIVPADRGRAKKEKQNNTLLM